RVLKIDPNAIAFDRKVTELGLDSLSSFELKNRVEALCDLTIPVAKFLQAPTVGSLAVVVTGLMQAQLAEKAAGEESSGENAASAGAGVLPTMARQAFMLGLLDAPVADAMVREAAELHRQVPLGASVAADRLDAAIAGLAARHEALRLVGARKGEDG